MESARDVRRVTDPHDPGPPVRAALARGHIVVLCVRCEPSIEAAREASRRASAWIEGIAALAGCGLSRSATPGMAVVAAPASLRVGVDVEATSTLRALGDAPAQWLHPEERPLLQDQEAWLPAAAAALWVRKEAVLKAFGVGLAVAPSAIAAGTYNEAWRTITHRIRATAVVRSVPAPAGGYALAVALLGLHPAPTTCIEITVP
jgi:phosphopantetheinyl transferase (holo-ACP synthase)